MSAVGHRLNPPRSALVSEEQADVLFSTVGEQGHTLIDLVKRVEALGKGDQPVQHNAPPAAPLGPTKEEYDSLSAQVALHERGFQANQQMACTTLHLSKSLVVPTNAIAPRFVSLEHTVEYHIKRSAENHEYLTQTVTANETAMEVLATMLVRERESHATERDALITRPEQQQQQQQANDKLEAALLKQQKEADDELQAALLKQQ